MQALDINSFTSNGKNFRASETIDLSDVENFLVEKGYRVKSIGQPWRNVFAHLESSEGEFFFKLASTAWVGERLKNEIDWNTQLPEALGHSEIGFSVPKILNSGLWRDRPYYVSEYFPWAFVQEKVSGECASLESWLERIVECNLSLLSLAGDEFHLYKDEEFSSIPEYTSALIKRIESWIWQIPERNLSLLREKIATFQDGFLSGVNHGDFVPWHMIVQGDKFVLIDGEHASVKTPRYYDIAYFFHRVYTTLENPVIAKKYLKTLVDRLDPKEKSLFELQFPKVLASRIIGGYFDAKHDGTDYGIHDRLQEEFLNNELC